MILSLIIMNVHCRMQIKTKDHNKRVYEIEWFQKHEQIVHLLEVYHRISLFSPIKSRKYALSFHDTST